MAKAKKSYKANRRFWGGEKFPSSISKGQTVELPDDIAKAWLEHGWIVEAPKKKKKVVVK